MQLANISKIDHVMTEIAGPIYLTLYMLWFKFFLVWKFSKKFIFSVPLSQKKTGLKILNQLRKSWTIPNTLSKLGSFYKFFISEDQRRDEVQSYLKSWAHTRLILNWVCGLLLQLHEETISYILHCCYLFFYFLT